MTQTQNPKQHGMNITTDNTEIKRESN